jgi:uncharacterized membrane protein
MVDVKTAINIHCRKIRIWEYVSDPETAPEWYSNILSASWRTPKPAQLGTQISFTARFMGRTLSYVYEITEWVPLEHLTMETVSGPFPMKTKYSFRSLDEETTRVTIQNTGDPKGFSRMFSRFIAWMMKRANRKDLMRLKKLMEDKYACET